LPGSREKIEVMTERLRMRVSLTHPGDGSYEEKNKSA
jgi:hypothetical protein